MTKSNGGTGSKQRGSFMKHAKETKELMEKFGFSTVEELEAALAGAQTSVAVAPAPAPRRATPEPDDYDPSIDPITWAKDEESVWLVGEISSLPGNIVPIPAHVNIDDRVEHLKAYATKTWNNCPYRFRGKNAEDDHNVKIEKAQHQHIRLDRFYAERVLESKFGRLPPTACIAPEDFKGRDFRGHPIGNKRKHSGDDLTELLRFYLQRHAGRLFIDYTYHRDRIDFNNPNPYGKGWTRWPNKVTPATPDGDVQRDWGEG